MAKKIVCVLALAVALGLSVSVQAQNQQPKPVPGAKAKPGKTTTDKGPTLDETMNWIVNSLSTSTTEGGVVAGHPDRSASNNHQYKFVKNGACSIQLVDTFGAVFQPGNATTQGTSEINFNLADFDPATVRAEPSPVFSTANWTRVGPVPSILSAATTNNENKVNVTVQESGAKSTAHKIFLWLDESLAQRARPAFVHAIELCGGKKSVF
jgi:hypothetical protein